MHKCSFFSTSLPTPVVSCVLDFSLRIVIPHCSFDLHFPDGKLLLLFFFKDFIYLFDREREAASERRNKSRRSGRGRSRLPAEDPDVGLDPRTPGSRPGPKADP